MDPQQQQFDSELQTYFLKIKHEIKQEHIEYLTQHPELKQILNDFTSQILLEKPQDVYEYAKIYFSYFNQNKDQQKFKPLVLSGPSGVGKGTLLSRMFQKYPNYFEFSVSYTTRDPRPNEVHGKHYFFVSKEEFLRVINSYTYYQEVEKQAFVEYCEVHGNYYGTHLGQLNDVMKQGKVCVLEIDVQGAEKIHVKMPQLFNYLFISPPSIDDIRLRLKLRGTEQDDIITRRVNAASLEMEKFRELGIYNEILNDDLDIAQEKFTIYLKEYYPDLKW